MAGRERSSDEEPAVIIPNPDGTPGGLKIYHSDDMDDVINGEQGTPSSFERNLKRGKDRRFKEVKMGKVEPDHQLSLFPRLVESLPQFEVVEELLSFKQLVLPIRYAGVLKGAISRVVNSFSPQRLRAQAG